MECNGGVYNVTQNSSLFEPHPSSETTMTTVVLPMIAVFGVLSNGAFIFVVSRLPHMRTPTNYYLVSLAVADTVDLCAGVGTKLLLFLASPVSGDGTGYGGPAGCMLVTVITNTAYFTTLFLITLVSMEKFYAVCYPLRVARGQAGRRAVRAIARASLVAVLLSMTLLPNCGVEIMYCLQWPEGSDHGGSLPTTFISYTPPYDWMSTYILLCRTFPFFATLTANFFFYIRIIRALGRQVAAMQSHGQANIGAGPHARNMVARMLVVTGTAYFVLLAPFEVTQLCFLIGYYRGVYVLEEQQALIIFQVARILSYINSAINPFIYGVINRKYREAYKLALRCKQHELG